MGRNIVDSEHAQPEMAYSNTRPVTTSAQTVAGKRQQDPQQLYRPQTGDRT